MQHFYNASVAVALKALFGVVMRQLLGKYYPDSAPCQYYQFQCFVCLSVCLSGQDTQAQSLAWTNRPAQFEFEVLSTAN